MSGKAEKKAARCADGWPPPHAPIGRLGTTDRQGFRKGALQRIGQTCTAGERPNGTGLSILCPARHLRPWVGRALWYSGPKGRGPGNGTSPALRDWKVPVGGGEETRVLESVYRRNFSVTPQGIYFIQAPDTDEPGRSFLIRFFDFATGRATRINSLPPGVGVYLGLTVSPDGRSILYTQVDQSQSDLMLVENFR